MEASKKLVAVLPVVEEAIAAVAPLAETSQISLHQQVADDVREIMADRTKVLQMLFNLLVNAVKFSNAGSKVCLEVRKDSPWACFVVRDEGIGIPEESQKLIFESFRQVDGSSTRRHGGSGLGLAITKKLVELHGGSIWVDSKPGFGSAFSFQIPLPP